jgi:hypothetical protein
MMTCGALAVRTRSFSSEFDQHATIVRRARLNSEKHIVADIGDDARRLVKRRLPDFQRMKDARARRACGIRLKQRLVVCRHD